MRPIQFSSGDYAVDRRAGVAAAMAHAQDFAAAAEVMAGALELAPHWTAGWQLLGDYYAHAGEAGRATAAYRQVQTLDHDGIFGATLTLAAHGEAPPPVGTDVRYVETLFDEYAGRFEQELLDDLGYAVPPVLGRMVSDALGGRPVARAVDLGCGTGLMGAVIRPLCARLEGVDLSQRMLAKAQRKGIYDRLEQAELVTFLSGDAGGIELLTAADVIIYCGTLPPVLAVALRAMAPGGLFGFSLELHEGTGTLLQRRQLRYAHNPAEAAAECEAAGFEVVTTERMGIRRERDVPVDGLVLLVRKPSDQPSAASSAA
ncbi:MAG: methyltransferase domain-containing protein [Hyphomicrobiales bacterium]|nr:MAG: methyltransferase domain-containing protein [Hyphomicrobiales bacterium]